MDQIEDYIPMVRSLAQHMVCRMTSNIEVDDLIQAGSIGLIEAFRRFDSAKGVPFEAFALLRIRGAMLDQLRENDDLAKSMRDWKNKMLATLSKLEQELLRKPTEGEAAAALKMDLSTYGLFLLAASVQTVSLILPDDDADEDGGLSVGKIYAKTLGILDIDPLLILLHKERITHLVHCIEAMPERLSYVLEKYFSENVQMKDIAIALSLSESRVSQLIKEAVAQLKKQIKHLE